MRKEKKKQLKNSMSKATNKNLIKCLQIRLLKLETLFNNAIGDVIKLHTEIHELSLQVTRIEEEVKRDININNTRYKIFIDVQNQFPYNFINLIHKIYWGLYIKIYLYNPFKTRF